MFQGETACMMKQILGAVEACHVKHCVTHRDLKPENFLLVKKNDLTQLRMIDFGLSRFFVQVWHEGLGVQTPILHVHYSACVYASSFAKRFLLYSVELF